MVHSSGSCPEPLQGPRAACYVTRTATLSMLVRNSSCLSWYLSIGSSAHRAVSMAKAAAISIIYLLPETARAYLHAFLPLV